MPMDILRILINGLWSKSKGFINTNVYKEQRLAFLLCCSEILWNILIVKNVSNTVNRIKLNGKAYESLLCSGAR